MLAKTGMARPKTSSLAMRLAILKVPRRMLPKSLIGKKIHKASKQEKLPNKFLS